jgi:quercetin dioxygenase-like cupin family protein
MRTLLLAATAIVAIMLPVAPAAAQHMTMQADGMKWGAAPPAFPPGAQIAVLAGNPSQEGPYVIRLKLPAGYKVAPHTHPADENVTVISGSFNIGMGDKLDQSTSQNVKAGGFAHVPKGMPHYAWFGEDTVVQIHGQGPAALNYINPADDPRNK